MSAETAAAEVLRRARALVARHGGWGQGHDVFAGTCHCVVTALMGSGGSYDEIQILKRIIKAPSLARWNDEPGRTQAEVVAAFDKAIAAVSP